MTKVPAELDAARERFAAELTDVRGNLHEELGWAPRGMRWIVPIVALAAGVVAGAAVKRNLPSLLLKSVLPRRRRR